MRCKSSGEARIITDYAAWMERIPSVAHLSGDVGARFVALERHRSLRLDSGVAPMNWLTIRVSPDVSVRDCS